MERRFALAAAALAVFVASAGGVGCSASADDDAPPAHPAGGGAADGDDLLAADEQAELEALAVADDEPIVDEGDVDERRDGVLEENPIDEDEEEVPDVQPLAVSPLGAPGPLGTLGKEPRVSIASRKYKCPGKPGARPCVCEGSPLNCELPNDQPGRNRYLPPSHVAEVAKRGGKLDDALINAGRWEIVPGTQLHDGQGKVRGTFRSQCMPFAAPTGLALATDDTRVCAKINFGQMKNMKAEGASAPRTFVYAFNVFVNGVIDSSGWIPLDGVVQKAELAKMGSRTPRRIRSFVATRYVVKSARDWRQDPATFSAEKLPAWSKAKVAPGAGSKKVGDYLLRDGNVINLAYMTPGVGGAATDTFVVSHQGLAFRRVKSTARRPTLVRIPVDDAKRKGMVFAYGSMEGRFGWVALAAIKVGSVTAAPAAPPSACDGKPDGTFCSDLFPMYGFTCRGGALVTALECPAPYTKCTGPSPDGRSLACAF